MSDPNNPQDRKARLSEARRALLQKRLQGSLAAANTDRGIVAQATTNPVPLSFTQQRVWFLQQLFPDNRAYNMHEAWRVRGSLDAAALERALDQVVARQASLRTRFIEVDGQPRQVIDQATAVPLNRIDLRDLPQDAREAHLHELIASIGSKPFDLSRGPLIRLTMIELGQDDHALLLSLHHIVTDEWSNTVFWRELAAFYAQELGQGAAELPNLPVQYSDYARWQREQRETGTLDPQMRYWRDQLDGYDAILQLPIDRPRPPAQSLKGGLVLRVLDSDLLADLQSLSQNGGATLYMTLLAAFYALLYRYSNQDDITVGTPIANRQRPEIRDVMGMFINTAVIRASLAGHLTFAQLLDQVRSKVLDTLHNQDLPFDLLVREMHPERDLSHNPLFQTMFVYSDSSEERSLPGATLTRIPFDLGVAKFDLTLFASEAENQLVCALEYSADLFDRETAVRILSHWHVLLRKLVANPQAAIETLPLLPAEELQRVLEAFNDTAAPEANKRPVHVLIGEQAALHPEATAVVSGAERLSYAALNTQAEKLARLLRQRGVLPGTPVALYIHRSAAMIVGILGILKAGAAYVPLEPAYPEERIAFALADTGTPLVVTHSRLAAKLPQRETDILLLDALPEPDSATPVEVEVEGQSLAYIIYTSGSTGKPKGVMVTHDNLQASTLARLTYYGAPVENYLLLSSFAFDSSVAGIFWTLVDGGTLVLPQPDEEKDVAVLAETISREAVTHILALPALYRLLLTYAPSGSLDSLQVAIVAGEACPSDLGPLHHRVVPQAALHNEYGPTEATVWCSVYQIPSENDGRPVPIGRPIANTCLYILDPHLKPQPIGVPGELCVAGPGVALGYWQRPDLTADRFSTLPWLVGTDDGRVYRTGDLARWRSDGLLEFLGRVDNQVKLRGFRVELGEIENALLSYPAVEEAVVTLLETGGNAEASAAERKLIAYAAGPTLNDEDESSLRHFLAQSLPDYMVPVQFVLLPALPRTPNGKVDRRQLPEPAPDRARRRPLVAPRTPAEQTLARIWSDVLNLPDVGIEDKFFELGGDSIMSIQVIARARVEGLVLTARQIFQEKTIARLAAAAGSVASFEQQTAADPERPFGLTPIQSWFFDQTLAQPQHWNQAVWFKLDPAVDTVVLKIAVAALAQHHPMLRARFELDGGRWQQVVDAAPISPDVTQVSLVQLDRDQQREAMLSWANRLHAELDLEHGPVLRAARFDLEHERSSQLLLVAHHLVVDAVSWSIITADLDTACRQAIAGETINLPQTPTSYGQWARFLQLLANSKPVRDEIPYWQAAGSKSGPLPRSGADTQDNREGDSALITVTLPKDKTSQLLRDVHQAYHTRTDDLLVTALLQAMAHWTGETTLRLTLERHGREDLDPQLDISQTVGWFTSLFPVTLTISDPHDYDTNLRTVKEQLRTIPRNGVGYGILRYLGDEPVRSTLGAQQQPDVLFNFTGRSVSSPSPDSLVEPLVADIGRAYGPQNQRAHLLDINAHIVGGCLIVRWQYPPAILDHAVIERVAAGYITQLDLLIEHCLNVDHSRHTPSDFPLAGLQQEDLDSLSDLLAELD